MSKKKILVIDDEASFTFLVKHALPQYEILAENDALRGLETARQFQPDLILLDVIMPGMEGGDLATQMREDPTLCGTPIVFLTAIVSPTEMGGKAQMIGGYPFLAKPASTHSIVEFIDKHLPGSAPAGD